MIISFEVSGGYGGLFVKQPLAHRIDVDQLAEPTRSELLTLIEASNVRSLRLPAPAARRPGGQAYRISVEEGGTAITISCDDVSAPASLRPLLAYLQRLAIAAKAPNP